MSKPFVKLTLMIAVEEVDSFLNDYPNCLHPEYSMIPECQIKMTNTELRQRSLEHITRHIPKRYEIIDCARENPEKPKMPYSVVEQGIHIKALVKDGIFQILP
ncbi:hypothetical protein [Pseudanabaena mucicola]|uniref:Uncharacterized protein n=1 Tax=Pseudanabaena mucicola FACHB-723 TaxID=2692860 RepID=A0ABR7ZZ91_9CYAN|nr:hypothetical protein [Pseudanabaena mucicola]MBD2189169.1 hypothetical protein [Pseudanabaena mucicola FACHB-723]